MPSKKIPGTGNKKIPGGRKKMPAFNAGNFLTRVQPTASSSEWNALHRTQVRDSGGRFSGTVGFAWQGLEAMANNIVGAVDTSMETIDVAMRRIADDMESYAKSNHLWQNRTGDAEAGLQAQVVRNGPDNWTIWLGHGRDVYYGLWLEVRWGGKYAIILPTLQQFAPQFGGSVVAPGVGNG